MEQTPRIEIMLNGASHEVPAGATITTLLATLELGGERLAVERNADIVSRQLWPATTLDAGDRLEIVHFVGGG
ncbi:MAG: sulfur carrier protein ThiS [Blastocatellia bacterium]